MNEKKLFNEFPPVSTEEWEKVIQADLKGADYEKKLVWKTNEGLKVKPYYRAEDLKTLSYLNVNPAQFPYVRGASEKGNSWLVRQDVVVNNLVEANTAAREAVERGATALGFILCDSVKSPADLAVLLNGICLKKISVNFVASHHAKQVFDWIAEKLPYDCGCEGDVTGSVDFDPLGHLTSYGAFMKSEADDFAAAKALVTSARAKYPKFRTLSVNGKLFGNSGATIVQEMAYSLAVANEYMARLTEAGVAADDVAKSIQFNLSVGSNYFLEIAKFRAFRLLWAKIVEAYKPLCDCASKAFIHATTTDWNKTAYDPYVNMLRVTTESMSSVLGGVDMLTVRGFDSIYKKTDSFSNRIARNTQILLKEEAYFEKIVDPAAGSYYIESLTDQLADAAWNLFRKVEAEGGYLSVLKNGTVQADIETVATKRMNDIATRREILLGTNQYPNFKEKMERNIDFAWYSHQHAVASNPVVKPLKAYRGALAFEELRLKTEKSGKTPKVFMLTIGNLAMRLARSQFSSNFFGCAGFELIDNNGFKSSEEGVKAALAAKADIVVVCSSDEEYAQLVPEIYELLKGKAIVVVAGAPACTDELKAKGIEHFINVKSNVLETLKGFQTLLNI